MQCTAETRPSTRMAFYRQREKRARWNPAAQLAAAAPKQSSAAADSASARAASDSRRSEEALGSALQGGRVVSAKLALPPRAGRALLRTRREPVLPDDRAHAARRLSLERIAREEAENRWLALQQSRLAVHHPGVLVPAAQRSEPQIPLEARLVRRVDPRRDIHVLGLEAEGIRRPGPAVRRALELDLVPVLRHDGEEAVAVRDPQRLERNGRPEERPRKPADDARSEHHGGAQDPDEHRPLQRAPPLPHRRRLGRGGAQPGAREKGIVEQQDAEHEHDVVQESVIGGEDDDRLERAHQEEAGEPERAREERHPYQQELEGEHHHDASMVEPDRQELLHVPAYPARQRQVLVVVIEGGQRAPLRIAAQELDHARLEVDAQPFPDEQEPAQPAGWIARAQARP